MPSEDFEPNPTLSAPLAQQGLLLRRFEDRDSVRELTEFLHRAYEPLAAMGLRFLATHQDETVTMQRMEGGTCYVVEKEGLLIATILYRSAPMTGGSPWYDRPEVASFGQFAVEPAYKGRGIGSLLLEFVEKTARADGATELALDTAEPAAHLVVFYQKRGYRFIEHAQWGGANYRSVILSKSLHSEPGPNE